MTRLLKTLCLLVSLLALGGCGAVNLVYNNAPTLLGSEFDDAFDLNDSQSEQVDQALEDFFAWHRKHELPRYQQILEEAAVAVNDGITATEMQTIYDHADAAARRSVAQLIDRIGALSIRLTPEQIDHYERYHQNRSSDFRDYLAMSEQQREIFRVNRALKRLDDWLGNMDEWQQQRVGKKLATLPDVRSTWIHFREQRHRMLVQAFRSAGESGITAAELHFILLDPDSEHAREYAPVRKQYRQEYAELAEELNPEFTKAQLRHASERLEYFAEIIEDLRDSS